MTHDDRSELSRRRFLEGCGLGLGAAAFGSLLAKEGFALAPQLAPKAKRVIFLHMEGAPSQLDLFDDKPRLRELNGETAPASVIEGDRFAFIGENPRLLGSPFRFEPCGDDGLSVSELLPHFPSIVDDVAVVRSMKTEHFNHAPAQVFMNSGNAQIGRPSMGSWVSYGLGSISEDLPAYVVMLSGILQPSGGAALWSSGFLPSQHQGVRFLSQRDPVLFLSDPPGIDRTARRLTLDGIGALNEERLRLTQDPEIATRIAQYELAFRMQTSVPELVDLSSEPDEVLGLYGARPGQASFANNCLLARRLVERGTRFVELYHAGWDTHGTGSQNDLMTALPERCRETDKACAALIKDLGRRGLLEDTLVIWGGEFGRTPMAEDRNRSKRLGRDHHPHAFTIWLAGAGIRPGITLGATDELGYHITEQPIEVHDLHATMLHLLGFDHERLTYRSQGRDFRLTDVAGKVVDDLLT